MPPEPTRFLTLGPAAHQLGCRVGPDSFFVFLHLARHAEPDLLGGWTVTASYRQLRAEVGLSKDTVARCLTTLCRAGAVDRVPGAVSTYRLHLDRADITITALPVALAS